MKVEKKQSQPSILDKAKKLAISKAVDQYAESYEKKTGKTVNAEALKSIFLQHADVVEDVMTKGDFEKKIKTAVDTVDVVEKMARIQDLNGNVVQTKELVKDKSALHVLFSPDSIDSRGDLKEEGKQAMQELVEMHDLTNPKKLGEFLVQLHIAQIEHFNERFELLEDLHLNDYSSRLMDGKTYLERYKRAQDETNQVSYLEKADDAFIKAIHRFEGALRIYVSDVKKIVRGPRFIRSIKLTKLDGDMKKIRGKLETMQELVALENLVGRWKKEPQNDIQREYQNFFDEVIGANLKLLQNYCRDEDDMFWKDIEENGRTILLME